MGIHLEEAHAIHNATCGQILTAAGNPMGNTLEALNGQTIDPGSLMALAFDLLDVPMIERQHTTRLMLLSMTTFAGSIVDPTKIKQIAKSRFIGKFFERLRQASVT